jgi:addiction module RelE/StbE family toxin
MKVLFSREFIKKYKRVNVRIRNRVDEQIKTFEKNPHEFGLRNHELHEEWEGYRSIDITNDYRAIFEELREGKETSAYFIDLGTHDELYS